MSRTVWGCVVLLLSVGLPARLRAEDGRGIAAERERARPLAAVKRFGYQLQKLDVAAASRSEADLLVIDPEGDGPRLAPDAVARLRRKPSG